MPNNSGGRQTFMFSATFPREIQRIADAFLRDYIFLAVGRVGSASKDVKQVIEYVVDCDRAQQMAFGVDHRAADQVVGG